MTDEFLLRTNDKIRVTFYDNNLIEIEAFDLNDTLHDRFVFTKENLDELIFKYNRYYYLSQLNKKRGEE